MSNLVPCRMVLVLTLLSDKRVFDPTFSDIREGVLRPPWQPARVDNGRRYEEAIFRSFIGLVDP